MFDASILAIEQLLALFWQGHDPRRARGGSQYRAVFLCESEQQYQHAIASREALAKKLGGPIATEVAWGFPFHSAEGYHQKWKLRRNSDLFTKLSKSFATEQQVVESFAATKLNAMVGGNLAQPDRTAAVSRLEGSQAAETLMSHFQNNR